MKAIGWYLGLGLVVALAKPAPGLAGQVEVVLSPSLREIVSRVDSVERESEQDFRRHRTYDDYGTQGARTVSADSVLGRVDWANERLVPHVDQYGVENLVKALVAESLARAGLEGYDRTLKVTIARLGVMNHSVAPLRGPSDFVTGTIEELDPANSNVLRSVDVVSNLVVSPTADRSYQGADFAFDDTDPSRRIGPSLAYFVTKGLRQLFPDHTFPKVVTVLFGERSHAIRPTLVRVR